MENEIERPILSWFYCANFSLIEIDLATFHASHRMVSFPGPPYDWNTYICPLPCNKLFCYGDAKSEWEKYPEDPFIINENYDVQFIHARLSGESFITYYNDCVYIFDLEFVSRFNLITLRWEKLVKYSGKTIWHTSTIINSKILATGYHSSSIFVFDILTLSFSQYDIPFAIKQVGALCSFEDSAYLIEATGQIFQSDKSNPFNWNILGNFVVIDKRLSNCKTFYNKAWYFLVGDSKILKFDLEKKEITYREVEHKRNHIKLK